MQLRVLSKFSVRRKFNPYKLGLTSFILLAALPGNKSAFIAVCVHQETYPIAE
jgi:hypothetical protein